MTKPGEPAYAALLFCERCGWYGLGADWMGGGLPDGLPDGTLRCPERCGGTLDALGKVQIGTYAEGVNAVPSDPER